MGNCLQRCFGDVSRRKYKIRTKYNIDRDSSIEFDQLIGTEVQNEDAVDVPHDSSGPFTVSSYMKWLVQQEEDLRAEEEAYFEAKREAARAIRLQRKQENGNKASTNGHSSWLANDGEWEIAGEDDFESFMESVRARSLSARTRELFSQHIPCDNDSVSSLHSKRSQTEASSVDLEWEHEAGMQPVSKDKIQYSDPLENITNKSNDVKESLSDSSDFEWDNDFDKENGAETKSLLQTSIESRPER